MKKIFLTAFVLLVSCSLALASSSLIVEKNLFSPDRSPPGSAASTPQDSEAPFKLKDIRLDGIIHYNHLRMAVLRIKGKLTSSKTGSSYVAVKEGESIGPYKITKIDKNKITIDYNGESHSVTLYQPSKKAPPPPPPPPPPAIGSPETNVPEAKQEEDNFPSPEEFKKLSPKERKKLIDKMRRAFLKRLERSGIEKLKSMKRESKNAE